jgi:hypothetical protein
MSEHIWQQEIGLFIMLDSSEIIRTSFLIEENLYASGQFFVKFSFSSDSLLNSADAVNLRERQRVLASGIVTPCSPMKVSRRFIGTCRLHLHDWRISQTRNQQACWFLLGLLFDPVDRNDMFLRNVGLTFNGLHGITSQKTELLKFFIGHVFTKVP